MKSNQSFNKKNQISTIIFKMVLKWINDGFVVFVDNYYYQDYFYAFLRSCEQHMSMLLKVINSCFFENYLEILGFWPDLPHKIWSNNQTWDFFFFFLKSLLVRCRMFQYVLVYVFKLFYIYNWRLLSIGYRVFVHIHKI